MEWTLPEGIRKLKVIYSNGPANMYKCLATAHKRTVSFFNFLLSQLKLYCFISFANINEAEMT